jgi:hypothetical protein
VRQDARTDRETVFADCARDFRFLADLTEKERELADDDPHHREQAVCIGQAAYGALRWLTGAACQMR